MNYEHKADLKYGRSEPGFTGAFLRGGTTEREYIEEMSKNGWELVSVCTSQNSSDTVYYWRKYIQPVGKTGPEEKV